MPEGIEVRKFADILSHNLVGHEITAINILKGRYTKKAFDGFHILETALPLKVVSVKTKGKFTYIELKSKKMNKTLWLFNTLGLTGGWTVCAKAKSELENIKHIKYLKSDLHEGYIFAYPIIWEYISNNNLSEWFEKALDHLNVEFVMDNGLKMYFYDQLSFGTLKIIDKKTDLEKKLKELGPDMLDKETTFEIFQKQITKKTHSDKAIGNVIVNQKVISGIGNYLRSDALWIAKISPFRKVSETDAAELELIYKAVRGLMWGDYNYDEAIKLGYISKDFKIPHDYDREFFVYRQDNDIHGNKVTKTELYEGSQKRFIYWIPNIQK
jgi:formamidopyrimidine-DNA glycosylase